MIDRPFRFLLFTLLPLAGAAAEGPPDLAPLMDEFCIDCHDRAAKRGGLNLEATLEDGLSAHPEIWEKVILRLASRQMPPPDEPRPDSQAYDDAVDRLSAWFDAKAAAAPDPGRSDSIRRLTRFEYRNAVRDLLGVEVDVKELLPPDESSQGFDNITLGTLPPTLLNRYVQAAQKISRLAAGIAPPSPVGRIVRVAPDLSQETQVEGLPEGTRGGVLIAHHFPVAGEYEVELRLSRDRNEEVEGLNGSHELEILLNNAPVQRFSVKPPPGRRDFSQVDAHLKTRIQAPAGAAAIGATFIAKPPTLEETKRQPYDANFNLHRHPRRSPAIYQVSITGPFGAEADAPPATGGPVFHRLPKDAADEETCAREIFTRLIRRAYRRPATEDDLAGPMAFFRDGRGEGSFARGIEAGLSVILVSPRFLLRVEGDPAGLPPGSVYPLDSHALATRLSFFLWSSLPDDELLDLADRGELVKPEVLEAQARRLLADPRSSAFITNFAGQWLHLRNLDSFHPDLRLFPDFDDNLRQSMRRETELFFESIVREDRGALDLLRADHTFLNERLARHYGIPGIRGSHFRRVTLTPESHRGGLLRHASILSVTSYAHRTSPVVRGNWILGTILGTPTPPPPPDVPSLGDDPVAAGLPMRERLAAHRADKSCATCHDLMDPVGFTLENFDATGRWRLLDEERPVDASGGLPDGSAFTGPDELERALLGHSPLFIRALCAKMMTYSLGRVLGPHDQPALRKIVRDSQATGHRFSDLVAGIVRSVPFTLRKTSP